MKKSEIWYVKKIYSAQALYDIDDYAIVNGKEEIVVRRFPHRDGLDEICKKHNALFLEEDDQNGL